RAGILRLAGLILSPPGRQLIQIDRRRGGCDSCRLHGFALSMGAVPNFLATLLPPKLIKRIARHSMAEIILFLSILGIFSGIAWLARGRPARGRRRNQVGLTAA